MSYAKLIKSLLVLLLLGSSTIASSTLSADTVYIRDVIYVPLRGGQSSEHRILHQGIRSGTELDRLEVNEDTGFTLVRTSSGLEGWIQNQYLVTEPIARDRLESMQQRLESLQSANTDAETQLESELRNRQTANERIDQLEQERQTLNQELSRITTLAADVINIDARNVELQQELETLNQQIDDLTLMNANLQDETNQTWYMIGAATIFVGMLFGVWFGRQMFGRRDTGWS